MLAADEHPGAFLEDELPFAPRPVEEAAAGPPPPDAWFQRWRVSVTALFVVLIALTVALAFGAKPDQSPAVVPTVPDPTSTVATAGATAPGTASVATAPGPATSRPSTPPPSASPPPPAGTSQPPVTPPPASPSTGSTVPGYATGSTQLRGPNEPPFIANPGQVQSTAGEPVRYQIGVSARPDERLTFSATGLPRGLTIDPATGLITGTPERAETTGVQVTAVGGRGSSFTQGFTWVVIR